MAKKQKKTRNAQDAAKRSETKQRKKLRQELFVCAVICAVVLAAAIGFLSYHMSYRISGIYQNAVVCTVDGTELTAADYDFFFYRAYYEYMNGASDGVMGIGGKPDPQLPLDQQLLYHDGSTTVTWQDYFEDLADILIRQTCFYYNLAEENGYVLSGEQEADIQYDFDEKIWFEAVELEKATVDAYLKAHYGPGMTQEIYQKNLRILFTANFYMEHYQNTIEIPNEELDSYYADHAGDYSTVSYRLFYLGGKEGNGVSRENAMKAAKERALELAEQAETEDDFIRLCQQYQQYNTNSSYWEGASKLRREHRQFALSYFRDWFGQKERKPGDVHVAEAANGYYVAMLLETSENDYPCVNLRYFTVDGEDPKSNARDFLKHWADSQQTPQTFFALSEDYRKIDYNTEYRKIDSITYFDQNRITVPDCMVAWCFDEPRSSGDTAAFAGEDGTVYVVYFEGYGELCSRRLAYRDLSEQQFRQWHADQMSQVTVEEGFFYYLIEK